jgi:ATP/ADP translocase
MSDRIHRVKMVGWLLGGFALAYVMLLLFFSYGVPDSINYFLLYLLTDQQFFLFPLAFWALANNIYLIAEAKRLFPIIGAGSVVGSILGSSLAAGSASFFAQYGGATYQLLGLEAILLLIGFGLLQFTFRNRPLRTRQSKKEDSIPEAVKEGVGFFKNVPLFRYLGMVILLLYVAYTIVQFHFLAVLDQTFESDLEFQAFYGVYRVGWIITTLLFQWLVTGHLLEKIGLKSSFIVSPIIMVIAGASELLIPGLIGGATGFFLIALIERAWDEPVRKSLEGLIPEERRGRVSTFLDSYLLAIGIIVGCIILLILFGVTNSEQIMATIYLTLALAAAFGAIWASIRVRSVYDESMLNWRLSRRQRRGLTGVMKILDK